jgi:hypothetical protein
MDRDSFPTLEGLEMCPRCGCCEVRTAKWLTPAEQESLGQRLRAGVTMLPLVGPNGFEHPAARDAWFCIGGCDDKGKHPDDLRRKSTHTSLPPFLDWTFIGWVKKV